MNHANKGLLPILTQRIAHRGSAPWRGRGKAWDKGDTFPGVYVIQAQSAPRQKNAVPV